MTANARAAMTRGVIVGTGRTDAVVRNVPKRKPR
jgi:hypothetical protein